LERGVAALKHLSVPVSLSLDARRRVENATK
jgi:hypothetical protein